MNPQQLDTEVNFYEHLAKLFYAVLMCDNSFHRNEAKRLQQILSEHPLQANENNVLSTEEGMQVIEKHIGELLTSNTDPLQSLDAFRDYRKQESVYFTDTICASLWKACNALAYSTAGQNKSELIILQEIKTILNQHL
jgi:hypothetical protein